MDQVSYLPDPALAAAGRALDLIAEAGVVSGSVIGVLGLGRVGMRVAQLARQAGYAAAGWDIDAAARQEARQQEVTVVWSEALGAYADAIVVAASVLPGRSPLVDADFLHWLRPDTTLVNVADESLVDQAAARAAQRAGRLGAYVTDPQWVSAVAAPTSA